MQPPSLSAATCPLPGKMADFHTILTQPLLERRNAEALPTIKPFLLLLVLSRVTSPQAALTAKEIKQGHCQHPDWPRSDS